MHGPGFPILFVGTILGAVTWGLYYDARIETYAKVIHKVELERSSSGEAPVILISYADVKYKGDHQYGKEYEAEITDKSQIDSVKKHHEYLINKDIEVFFETAQGAESVGLGRKSD